MLKRIVQALVVILVVVFILPLGIINIAMQEIEEGARWNDK